MPTNKKNEINNTIQSSWPRHDCRGKAENAANLNSSTTVPKIKNQPQIVCVMTVTTEIFSSDVQDGRSHSDIGVNI